MDAQPDTNSAEDVPSNGFELEKLRLERDKFEYEKSRSGRLTATQIALIGSLLSVTSGIVGAGITGWFSKQSEEVKLQAGVGVEKERGDTSLNIEKLKFETGLVLEAIKTDDQAKAVSTLKFYAKAGLIPTFEKRILTLTAGDEVPALGAFKASLPTRTNLQQQIGALTPSQVEALAREMQPALAGASTQIQGLVRALDPRNTRLTDPLIAKRVLEAWVLTDNDVGRSGRRQSSA